MTAATTSIVVSDHRHNLPFIHGKKSHRKRLPAILRNTSRTNTPGEAPVLCYQYCHNHPRNVKCWATRTEYFNRIMAKHGWKKRERAWA